MNVPVQGAGSAIMEKMRRERTAFAAGAACAAIVIAVCWDYDFTAVDSIVALSFLLNAVVIAWLFVRRLTDGPVDLLTVHLIATWFMLVVAPLSAYVTNQYYFYDFFPLDFSDSQFLLSNLSVLAWTALAVWGYRMRPPAAPGTASAPIVIGQLDVVLQVAAAVISLIVIGSEVGIGLTTRQAFESARPYEGASDFVLFNSGVRSVSYVALVAVGCAMMLRDAWTIKRAWLAAGILLAAAVLLVNNPVAAARFITGVVAVAVTYALWFRTRRSALSFFAFMVVAVFVAFPLLDLGRQFESLEELMSGAEWSPAQAIGSDEFRTYEAIPAAIEYIAQQGSTFGHQLLGNLLFFITRDVWPNKPVGTGTMLATYFGASFTNVACPLECEALVNFGYVGVPILAFAFGYLLRLMDDAYSRACAHYRNGTLTWWFVIYPFSLGFVFFLTRGDFLTPYSSFVLYMAAASPMLVPALWRRTFNAIGSSERRARSTQGAM
jgi:hypothetical protein